MTRGSRLVMRLSQRYLNISWFSIIEKGFMPAIAIELRKTTTVQKRSCQMQHNEILRNHAISLECTRKPCLFFGGQVSKCLLLLKVSARTGPQASGLQKP